MLPLVVGRQVELARARGDADAAADAHQPVVGLQALACFAGGLLQGVVADLDAAQHLVQHGFVDGGVAAVAHELLFVAVQIAQQVGFEVGPRGHVHHFKDGGQRVVVVHRVFAPHEQGQALEQVFKPQHRADALAQWVFVDDQRAT